MKPTLEVTEDRTEEFNRMIAHFKRDAVLIGIPEAKAEREDDDLINNATILAINEFGSPMNNIPPRPVMAIGIKSVQDELVELFKKAAEDAAFGRYEAWQKYLERAGILASNSVKKVINAQEGFDGPSESTLAARKARGFKGNKSLIVTGQMRNAITYVTRFGGNVQVSAALKKAAS